MRRVWTNYYCLYKGNKKPYSVMVVGFIFPISFYKDSISRRQSCIVLAAPDRNLTVEHSRWGSLKMNQLPTSLLGTSVRVLRSEKCISSSNTDIIARR